MYVCSQLWQGWLGCVVWCVWNLVSVSLVDGCVFMCIAYTYFILYSLAAYNDPLSSNMTALFSSLMVDALNEYAYSAEIAGIDYAVMNTKNSIRVSFIMCACTIKYRQSTLPSVVIEGRKLMVGGGEGRVQWYPA